MKSCLFLVLLCAAPIMAQGSDAHSRPTSKNVASGWTEIIAGIRPAIVVIETDKSLASGFVVKSDGIIVTNYHVVNGATAMAVKFPSGEIYKSVSLLRSDPDHDLAFLKIDAVDLPTVPLGNSNDAQVGDDVLLVGAPKGLEQTVSNGLISGNRIEAGVRVLQTSAAASPGSSGGPLLNRKGEAIGVMSFKVLNGENLNFTIPINYVRGQMDTLNVSDPKPFAELNDQAQRHRGVVVAGHGSAAFQGIFMEVLDILGEHGVEVANDRIQKVSNVSTTGFMPLSALLNMLPNVGADSLLYIKVEPGLTWRAATVSFQCFDASGHILWEETAKDVLVDGGNTLFHPNGWKKKLLPHIGKAGLVLQSEAHQSIPLH